MSLFDDIGSVFGTGDGDMRDRGRDGLTWDPEFFMMVLSKMNKSEGWEFKEGKKGEFSWEKYKPGRQSETSEKLIDKTGKLGEYGTPDQATGTGKGKIRVNVETIGDIDGTRGVISSDSVDCFPKDTVGGVLKGDPNRRISPNRSKKQ